MANPLTLSLTIPASFAGTRLDLAIAQLLPDHSRSTIQRWIREGEVTVNGKPAVAKLTLRGQETIRIQTIPPPVPDWQAQSLPLEVVFEDDDLLVIDKPAGMVVHPAAGHP